MSTAQAKAEVFRYLGHRGQEISAELDTLVEECMQVIRREATPMQACKAFDISFIEDGISLNNTEIILRGKDIGRHLQGCTQAVLMAQTLGIAADRIISQFETADITKSLVLDACATQYVEECCDNLEESIKRAASEKGQIITLRFSPGYGDLPLEIQPKLIAALEAEKRIGLTCTQSLIMIPRKSVTAIVGVGAKTQYITTENENCKACSLNETCSFKKGSGACGYSENTEE